MTDKTTQEVIQAEFDRANRSDPGNIPRSGYEDGYLNGLDFALKAFARGFSYRLSTGHIVQCLPTVEDWIPEPPDISPCDCRRCGCEDCNNGYGI